MAQKWVQTDPEQAQREQKKLTYFWPNEFLANEIIWCFLRIFIHN